MKVLCVEDNPAEARTVAAMLHGAGHDCDTTDLGEAAVDLAAGQAYDLIVLDIMLPDIDGYETMRRLRAAGVDTPVLIQSGLVDRDKAGDGPGDGPGDGRGDGPAFGFDEFLVKPFTKGELIERVDATVSGARPGRALAPIDLAESLDRPGPRIAERRRHSRFNTTKAARIVHGGWQLRCVILNLSQGGAAIWLPSSELDCPAAFELQLHSGPAYDCRVCWRLGNKLGVRFV
ncbi:MAG: response regulator [Rhodospirillales bacterium]|nr:response regulator [Rhodospirillales bacterium]